MFNFVLLLRSDSSCRTSKLLHHSLSITSINISIFTTTRKSFQIVDACLQLGGIFASEMRDIINLVSDIINLEAEDSSANANQSLQASRRREWDEGPGGLFTFANQHYFISLAQMSMRND